MSKNNTHSLKEIKLNEQHKKNISLSLKGKLKGTTLSDEHRLKLSEAHKGKKLKRIICPHCHRNIPVTVYNRFHGNNCKINKYEIS